MKFMSPLRVWTEEDLELLIRSSYHMNVNELFSLFSGKYSKLQIRRRLYKSKSTAKPTVNTRGGSSIRARFIPCDETFLDDINTPSKAYLLGFWVADGGMYSDGKSFHQITFSSNDKEHIELMRDLLHSKHNINCYGKWDCWSLAIGSRRLFNALFNLGFTPRKSTTVTYPSSLIPQFDSHFIRGVFDGDGCITSTRGYVSLSIYGSKMLLDSINNKIPIKAKYIKKDTRGNVWALRLSGESARQFLYYIYKDSDGLRLDRKYNRFIDYMNREGIFAPKNITPKIIQNKELILEEMRSKLYA